MKPQNFNQANQFLGAPENWDEEKFGKCEVLPVCYMNGRSVSMWKPTARELQILNEGGVVVLHVVGWQVPVWIDAQMLLTEDFYQYSENTCPGHVGTKDDNQRCRHCGIHIDELRPPEEEEKEGQ